MNNKRIPFSAVWGVIDYLRHDEHRHYCDYLLSGGGDDHVYLHVLELLKWLATVPPQAKAAQFYLDEDLADIAETKTEIEDAKAA